MQHPHRHRRRRVLLAAVTGTAALVAAGLTALTRACTPTAATWSAGAGRAPTRTTSPPTSTGPVRISLRPCSPAPRTTPSPATWVTRCRRHQAGRHPPVAHRPRPQHPLRRALHAVPGLTTVRANTSCRWPTRTGTAGTGPSTARWPSTAAARGPPGTVTVTPCMWVTWTRPAPAWRSSRSTRAPRRHPHRQVRHPVRDPSADRLRRPPPTMAPRRHRPCRATSSATGARRPSGRRPTTRPCGSAPRRTRRPRGSPPCCTTLSTACNQPLHPNLFIGDGMATPPGPTIRAP